MTFTSEGLHFTHSYQAGGQSTWRSATPETFWPCQPLLALGSTTYVSPSSLDLCHFVLTAWVLVMSMPSAFHLCSASNRMLSVGTESWRWLRKPHSFIKFLYLAWLQPSFETLSVAWPNRTGNTHTHTHSHGQVGLEWSIPHPHRATF